MTNRADAERGGEISAVRGKKISVNQMKFRRMVFFGLPIFVLGFFTSLRAAEPQLSKTAESFATSEVKSNALSYPTCAAPPEAHQEEEEKCLDQRLLLGLVRPLVDKYPAEKQRQDLTFKNFFTYGWDVGWKEPDEGPNDAPRFGLLRIQRAFWEREIRLVHSYTFGVDGGAADEQELEMEVELPINRRFLIEFEPAVSSVRANGRSWDFGAGDLKVIPQVMLWETKDLSFSSILVVRTPTGTRRVGEGRTSLMPSLALWTDLGERSGLHTFFGAEFPLDGYEAGHRDAVLQYGIAPAKTVTSKDTLLLGNLTFFAEFNGTTDMGRQKQTTLTLLPGVRWLLFKDFWLATGYEFPLTGTNALESRVWFSIYRDF